MYKCRLLVLFASLTQQRILAYFPTGNNFLKIQLKWNASGWRVFRLAMACKFFGGLTNVSRLATAEHWMGWRWRETAAAYRSIVNFFEGTSGYFSVNVLMKLSSNIYRKLAACSFSSSLAWLRLRYETLRPQDTSTPRHFGSARDTAARHQKRSTRHFSAPDREKVETFRTQDNSNETRFHRWFGLNLVPKCLAPTLASALS